MVGRGIRPAGLFFTLAWTCLGQTAGLKIIVAEGEGALNNIQARRAKEPVVRVEDGSGNSVAGAVVNFILPANGAGGTFGDGELSLTAAAGPGGEVMGRGLKPNRVAGPFQIRVTASARGESATATIHQTNVEPAAGGGSGKKVALAALIGGAAIGGIIAATRGGGGSGTPSAGATAAGGSAPGGVSVVPGAPSFGPPR